MNRTIWMGIAALVAATGLVSPPAGFGQAIEIQIDGGAVAVDGAVVRVEAVAKAKEDEEDAEPEVEFPEKLDKALEEFLDKCVEARREPARKEIAETIEELKEFHELDEEVVEKLKEQSKKAVEASLEPWKKEVQKFLTKTLAEELGEGDDLDGQVEEALEELAEAEPDDVVSEIPSGEAGRPDQQKEWVEALEEVLTEEQLAAWQAKQAEEKDRIEQQFAKLIEITSDNYKRQYGTQMDPIVEDILSTVELDEARSGKLKKAAEEAIKAFIENWKKKAVKYVKEAESTQRESMLKRGYISIGVETDSVPQKQEVWAKALDTILTKEERSRWDEAIADRDARRDRAAKLMVLAAVDELMALTGEQREQLEKVLTKKAIESLTSQLKRDYWGSMNVSRIVQNAKEADQKKVREILDDAQWKRWEAAIKTGSSSSRRRAALPKKDKDAPKPPPGPDPVAIEKAITGHLYRLMLIERERILSTVLVQAEDASRVVALSPAARQRLQIAAKGAAEEEINTWAASMNSWVRRSVKGATPGNIDERLRNLGTVRFGRSKKAQDTDLWKAALKSLLNDEQQEAWQGEIEARQDFRRTATASLIVTQLDSAARLTGDQVSQIEPLLVGAVEKYGPDIDRYFSSWSNDSPWYLNSYYNMIPFQGIPEKEAKQILSKPQWKIWEERFHNRVSHYWDQVLDYHDQRMKKEEKERTAAEEAKKKEEAAKATVEKS